MQYSFLFVFVSSFASVLVQKLYLSIPSTFTLLIISIIATIYFNIINIGKLRQLYIHCWQQRKLWLAIMITILIMWYCSMTGPGVLGASLYRFLYFAWLGALGFLSLAFKGKNIARLPLCCSLFALALILVLLSDYLIKVVEGTTVTITPKIEERESSLSDYYWTAYPLSSSALGAKVNASNHSISFTAPAYTAASHFYHLTIHAKSGPGQISASTIVEVLRNPIPIIKILSGATNLPDHSGRPITSGTIKFQIQGGVAPYTVTTSNKNIVFKASGTNTLKVTNNATHTEEIDYTQDISPQRKLDIADFKLTVTDAKKKKVASIIMPLSIWGSPTATFEVKVGAYTLTPSRTSAGTRYIVKPNDSVNLIANAASGYNLTYTWDNVSSHSASTANLATASSLYNNVAAHVTDGFGRKVDHTFNAIDSRPLPNIQELKMLDYNQTPYTSATATYGNRVDYAAPHHHNSFSILLTIPQVSPTNSLYLDSVDKAYAYDGYSMFASHVTGYNNNTVGKIAFIDTTSAPHQGENWRFHWSNLWQDSSTYLWTAGVRRTYYDGSVVYSNNGTGVCWHAYGSGRTCASIANRSH